MPDQKESSAPEIIILSEFDYGCQHLIGEATVFRCQCSTEDIIIVRTTGCVIECGIECGIECRIEQADVHEE